ncbi:MAG: 3-phosphoshikimate 1-carboxyvinyltransferase [Synechococcus sp.]|nr:3-phosphoshikimate 1-carboxyvinyltransferase [Synechococcus sp.]
MGSVCLSGGGSLHGSVRVPGDKSISHRALLFGAIATGTTTIEGLLPAEDPLSTAACLRAMGVTVSAIDSSGVVRVEGVGLDGLQEPAQVLDCGNSGTTMRLMLGLLAGRHGRHFVLDGDGSLRRRPMARVAQPLAQMGAEIGGREGGNKAPLAIAGQTLSGGTIRTPVASAQVKSALLLAGLTAKGSTTVIEPALSRDHSERMLRAFGADLISEPHAAEGPTAIVRPGAELHGQHVVVPGDISSAAFWLIAALVVPGTELTIENVGINPRAMGAELEETTDGMVIPGGQRLTGAQVDSETDHRVAMSLAVAALIASGDTSIDQSEAAAVSYPSFWDELARLQRG